MPQLLFSVIKMVYTIKKLIKIKILTIFKILNFFGDFFALYVISGQSSNLL